VKIENLTVDTCEPEKHPVRLYGAAHIDREHVGIVIEMRRTKRVR
jgi:hypothetical protein